MGKSKHQNPSRNRPGEKRSVQKTNQNSLFRPPLIWIVALVVLAVIAGAGFAIIQGQQKHAQSSPVEISVQEAYRKYQQGVFMLDVREPSEWEEYHVEGATLIPLGELESRASELPKDQEILVICHSGNRSKQGEAILRSAGFTNVSSVSGGLLAWIDAGYPTVKGP